MDRVLFIVPPYVAYDSYVNPAFNERVVVKKSRALGSLVTDMPIGVLSLSAYLKKYADVETRLVDFNTTLNKMENFEYASFSDLFRDLLSAQQWIDYDPTIIGISTLFTPAYYNTLSIAQVAREIFPNAVIVGGGGVPTNMYNQIFADSTCWDGLCYGEGEKPLLGLVNAPDKKKFLSANQSWITPEKTGAKQSFQHDVVENLDDIPFYDYDILNAGDYELSPTISSYASFGGRKRVFHVATSRGCPHRCCFCSSHTVHGRVMRHHSVARVSEDLKRLREQYGAEIIGFQDDNFMADKRRAAQIIGFVKDLRTPIFFQSGLALYALDREMLEAIKGAGIKELVLPIESGSNRVLREVMHKPISLSIVKRVVDDCRELGIDTDANILIGLPGETKQDIEETRAFLTTLDATWFRIYVATPLVGSEMYNTCAAKNYLKGSHIGSDFKRAVIETEDFTASYIQEKAYSLNLELNFVRNSDFRLGNYDKALKGFENTIRVKSDHAFAYYYAAQCCSMLGRGEQYVTYKAKYQLILRESDFWRDYSDQFGLMPLQ